MNDNNTENTNEENVSLFDMYGVDQEIKHKEPTIAPVEKEENISTTVENTTESVNNEPVENTEINSLSDMNNESNNSEAENNEVTSRLDTGDDPDEELVAAFIGDAYEDYRTNGFNIGAFFFGVNYFFYRKMFLYGIGLMCFSTILSIIPGMSLFSLVIPFLGGLFGNRIYYNFAKNKVQKLKVYNEGISRDELIEICRRKGGKSILCAIVPFIVICVILTFLGMLIVSAEVATK